MEYNCSVYDTYLKGKRREDNKTKKREIKDVKGSNSQPVSNSFSDPDDWKNNTSYTCLRRPVEDAARKHTHHYRGLWVLACIQGAAKGFQRYKIKIRPRERGGDDQEGLGTTSSPPVQDNNKSSSLGPLLDVFKRVVERCSFDWRVLEVEGTNILCLFTCYDNCLST